MLSLSLLMALALAEPSRSVDVAIVPGCPSRPDGLLSECQWRRVLWAQHLYASGVVRHLVTSGSAVQNRFVEAEAMAAGLFALGVPPAAVTLERDALHSDENVACALPLIERDGHETIAVASDPFQAPGLCAMVTAWTRRPCVPLSMDQAWVYTRYAAGVPGVSTPPIAEDLWLPLDERERRIASLTGHRRGNSWGIYIGKGFLAVFGLSRPPPVPPPLEALRDVR